MFTPRDPLMDALADLNGAEPREDRAAVVRARCHAALAEAHPRPAPIVPRTQRALDRLLPVAVIAYGVLTVVEGLRLAGLI